MDTTNKRRKLLDASLQMANEKSYSNLRISDITERAGVAKGTFYTYFENKDDCFKQASYEIADYLYNKIMPASAELSNDDIEKVADIVYNLSWTNRKLGRMFAYELLSEDKEFNNLFTARNKNVYKEITRLFVKNTSEEDLETKAFMIMGIIDALICEVFICDCTDEELARKRFKKAFKTIVLSKIL